MTDPNTHTPLPWAVEDISDSEPNVRPWIGRLEENGYTALVCGDTQKLAIQNAAFIVRAVNSHYELLEALKRATDCAQALLDFAERQCEIEGCSTAIEADIHAARAAIAKATGEA